MAKVFGVTLRDPVRFFRTIAQMEVSKFNGKRGFYRKRGQGCLKDGRRCPPTKCCGHKVTETHLVLDSMELIVWWERKHSTSI